MENVIKEKKKKKVNVVSVILCVVLLSVSAFLLYEAYIEIKQTFDLRAELETAQKLLAEIKKENVELAEQKEKLEDPEYVKSYARGIYMLSKEGEQIFYLPSEDE